MVAGHDVKRTVIGVADDVTVDVVTLTVTLVTTDADTSAHTVSDLVVSGGVLRPTESDTTRVRIFLFLTDIVLDEVVRAAFFDVDALVTVGAESVMVDPVVTADVSIHVVGASGAELYLGSLARIRGSFEQFKGKR